MKFALFTGCVAKGATRELMLSTTKAAEGLGFDFIEMKAASCCGAGVVSEKSPLLADAAQCAYVFHRRKTESRYCHYLFDLSGYLEKDRSSSQ